MRNVCLPIGKINKIAIATIIVAGSVSAFAHDSGDWKTGGADIHNTRNVTDGVSITAQNVHRLKTKWIYPTAGDVSATPAVVGDKVYVPDWGGYLHCVDANTGVAVWAKKISSYTGGGGDTSILGLPIIPLSRTAPVVVGDLLILGDQGDLDSLGVTSDPYTPRPTAHVFAVNRNTGALVWCTTVSLNPFACITGAGVAHHGTVYFGISSLEEGKGLFLPTAPYTFQGGVVALDVHTGAIKWTTPTTLPGYAGCAVWGSTPVIDENRGSLYIGTGDNYSVPAGCSEAKGIAVTPGNHVDSIVAMDLETGKVKWSHALGGIDTWNETLAPGPDGYDYDFGSAPNLFTANFFGYSFQLLGAGEKSGKYWALNPDNGQVVWSTQVGPGGTAGGIQWGSAVDGTRVYCAVSNSTNSPYTLLHSHSTYSAGSFNALDALTGIPVWQTPDPAGYHDFGMVTSANGVIFAGSANAVKPSFYAPASSTGGHLYALDACTGSVLWDFVLGNPAVTPLNPSTICGPAVVGNSVYWGTGYAHFSNAFGGGNSQLYAFSLQ
jgi:polyvinyl alcohol dehydrogenase (cytochrome)